MFENYNLKRKFIVSSKKEESISIQRIISPSYMINLKCT